MGRRCRQHASARDREGSRREEPPIRIGVISPLTGAWTAYGRAHFSGFELAVDEINRAGGVLGRRLQIVVADSQTNPRVAAEEAHRLIRHEQVSLLAGTFSSAERNAVGPVVAAANCLLLYPTFYEGQDPADYPGVCNQNIFMFGLEPTQQVWPHVEYMLRTHGRRFFLIGSDYVWPRGANRLAKQRIREAGGEIVGETYLALGTRRYEDALEQIRAARPDVIFSSVAAYDSVEFRRQLHAAGMRRDMVLWSVDDEEIVTTRVGAEASAGDYASFDYFMALHHPNNHGFLARLRRKFGRDAMTNTVGVAMYNAAHMVVQAIAHAGTLETGAVREALSHLRFDGAPQGTVRMRPTDHQAILPSHLLRVRAGWTGGHDMFEPVQSFESVEPSPALSGVATRV
ncbi:MAG: substrate-binding protein [Armatimonadota bacterium]|nr:substrate-binding protein [Armatimonadota bacterium]